MNSTYDTAFGLYMEKVSGHLTAEEESRLQETLAKDEHFRKVWEQLEKEAPGLQAFVDTLDPEDDLRKLKDGLQRPVRKISYKKSAIAAAVLLMAGAGWLYLQQDRKITDRDAIAKVVMDGKEPVRLVLGNGKSIDLSGDTGSHTIRAGQTVLTAANNSLEYRSDNEEQNTLSIPAGETYKLTLSDGTEVSLNSMSHLRFPFRFGEATREVYVDGEAYFQVAADASKPFIVHTPLTDIRVLGTEFNVNTYDSGSVHTALIAGKVTTSRGIANAVTLRPGYASKFEPAKGFSSEKFDRSEVLSWMNGTYYFYDMPVARLTDIIFRCYGLRAVADSDKFAQRSLTGLMNRNDLQEFLQDLETTAHISYHYSGGVLHLE